MLAKRYLCVAVLLWAVCPVAAARRTEGVIGRGTQWATPYYVIDSELAGPTVMVTGGMHGNEPAGARAAGHIRFWTVRRGKLIVVPRLNVQALAAQKRFLSDQGDWNRNFPMTDKPDKARGAAPVAIWAFVKASKPDWLLDLHEGFAFRKSNPKSTGASIISLRQLKLGDTVKLMLDAVNASVSDEGEKLVALRGSADGSLARAAAQRLGVKTMILETCYTGQYMSLRTRQHRVMVHRLLRHLKMADSPSHRMAPVGAGIVRVAIYNGLGTGNSTGLNLEKILLARPGTLVRLIGPPDIAAGVLADQFDAVLFGGGSGKGQATNIASAGHKAVREFVKNGGGYMGICGGAYLATSKYDWGLKIIDARAIDTRHWKRGKGSVKIELTKLGQKILGPPRPEIDVPYANGPLLGPYNRKDLDDYEVLANFRGEINENNAPKGVMMNSPAMITGQFGTGKVILFSPHPEKIKALHGLVQRAIEHVARGKQKQKQPQKLSASRSGRS